MKIEKKLFAYSLLALIVGVASIVPLMFIMSGTAKAETDEPHFDVEVPYAYIRRSTSLVPSNLKTQSDMIELQTISHTIVLNFTLIEDTANPPCDARIEYYIIYIYSDKGYIGNLTESVGATYNSSFQMPNFSFSRENWFDTGLSSGGGLFYYTWTTGASHATRTAGHGTNWVSTFGEPETITISIQRLGWITFDGDSTVATLADGGEIARVHLEKFENGFLYNNLFPEDQLSQIDLLNPPY
jgi:hypothetical protein